MHLYKCLSVLRMVDLCTLGGAVRHIASWRMQHVIVLGMTYVYILCKETEVMLARRG